MLVSIFSLLDESKFQHFRPVMDAYIDSHFAAALVYKYVLNNITITLLNVDRFIIWLKITEDC